MDTKFVKALKEVLREQLVEKNSVDIDGLGIFEVKHYEQHQKRYSNGKVVMMPPADVLEFKSNIKESDEN
ncbi:MAG: HU family DNA-binding protein [Balneolaceae bacterium]